MNGGPRSPDLRLKTFAGGAHPPTHKDLTRSTGIVDAALPERVVVPLRQSLGAPAEACVKIGDAVRVGQKIGEANGFISVPVHASVSGKVVAIGRFPHPLGSEQPAIVIEGDGADEWHESVRARGDARTLSAEEIRSIVREAGIVGQGGAAFPTHVKLTPPESKPIDTAVLNGAECEPWLTADHRLMLETPAEILEGFLLIMKALGCSKGLVGVEANKMDAVAAMVKAVPAGADVTVVPLEVKYPQGAEKQLIDALLRRKVPSRGLPMDVGVVVQNVGTSFATYEACLLGRPLVARVLTLAGTPLARPANYRARIGTLVSALVQQSGGIQGEVSKVVVGGPMMGIAQATLDVPVVKGTSGVLLFAPGESHDRPEEPCLRCGRCVDTCPMRLVPTQLEKLVAAGRIAAADAIGLWDCMECGSCAYVCPSKRPLVHVFKLGKHIATEQRKTAVIEGQKEGAS